MDITISILQRVLINHFYRLNSGLFVFLFFILFGLPQQPYLFHRALIIGILESQVFLLFAMALWLLYNIKCVDYIVKQLNEPRLAFLFCMNNLSFKKRFIYVLYVQGMIFLPILLYAGAIILMAITQSRWIYIFEVICYNILLLTFSSFIYVRTLEKRRLVAWAKLPTIKIGYKKPFFIFPLLHLWYARKQMLLVTKTFSLLILWVFMLTYEPVRYDIRPLVLCLLLCVIAHTALIIQVRKFDEQFLSFTKNLPLTSLKRFTSLVIAFLFLLLPELVFLYKGYGIHFLWQDYPQLVLTSIALLAFFYTVLLIDQKSIDKFVPTIFGISAVAFFILLYNPGILFGLAILILSYALFASYVYHSEERIENLR